MNISQPIIHHPIATSLQFHHRAEQIASGSLLT